jgi:hypothetical protein
MISALKIVKKLKNVLTDPVEDYLPIVFSVRKIRHSLDTSKDGRIY